MDLLLGLFSLGIFSFLPWIIALVAIVDVVRLGAPWYWIWVILAFPMVGAAAYFVVVRSGWLGGRQAAMSPDTARRLQARRRLRELNVQLSHWRGPAVLAEAGEELLVLGKHKEAEKHFLEARENGAGAEDVNFGLAQTYQMQGRFADAVPLLDELVQAKPDAFLGRALLQLGRSLDESGQKERAEKVLRDVLERRTIIEAQVRLARLLLARGEKEEARRILQEVKTDAANLPRYLRRQHRSWIWTARGLRSGSARLPRPYVEGGEKPGRRLRLALAAAAAVAVVGLVAVYGVRQAQRAMNTQSLMDSAERYGTLYAEVEGFDKRYPWTRGGDLAKLDLTAADLDRYLRVRRELEPAVQKSQRQLRELKKKALSNEDSDNPIAQALNGSLYPFADERAADAAFLQSVRDALDRERMGPRELMDLLALVEWHFLKRPEAVSLGLPDFHHGDWIEAWVISEAGVKASGDTQYDRQQERAVQQARAKLASFEQQAAASADLSPATKALLDPRRAEMERFDPNGLPFLLVAIDPAMNQESP
jgi:hypothetical protein